jgi:signal transduction histidine kinase
MQATLNIPEMDHLFPRDVETNIYRIIQESLTNIGKHAQARHVSMVTKIGDDGVRFIVNDDGKGFNVEHALRRDASDRGMGLTTMSERARILGGFFDLWSQEEKGSRITFCIPKKNGGTLS